MTELDRAEGRAFFVEDGSGALARVEGAARVVATERRVADTRFLDAEPEAFRAFMNAEGRPTTALMGSDLERLFYERVIQVGAPAVVAGVARLAAGPPRLDGYRQTATRMVVLERPVVFLA